MDPASTPTLPSTGKPLRSALSVYAGRMGRGKRAGRALGRLEGVEREIALSDSGRDHRVPAGAQPKTRREQFVIDGYLHMRDSELGKLCAERTEVDLVKSNTDPYLLVYHVLDGGRSQIGRLTPESSVPLIAAIDAGQKPHAWAVLLERHNEQVSLTIEVEYEPV